MKKIILITLLFLNISLNASLLKDSIRNIIGERTYQVNKFLINSEFKNEKIFYIGDRLKYKNILSILKNKGLLRLKFATPQQVKIEFRTRKKENSKKLVKTIKDVLGYLGYTYYFTDFIIKNDYGINWQINFKSESMLDPYMLISELEKLHIMVLGIKKVNNLKWEYDIDLSYSKISDTIFIQNDEKITLHKTHKAYMLEINGAKYLNVKSARLNSWHPRISFYDKDLNVLNIIKKQKEYKVIKAIIPEFTKYIMLDDTFTLLNIKRGLTVIVR